MNLTSYLEGTPRLGQRLGWVVVKLVSSPIDNTVVDMTQSGYPASGESNTWSEYTNTRRSL